MISYIIRSLLSSGLLLGIYYLFLANEKMFLFNRFYLLFCILFPFLLPFITLNLRLSSNNYSTPLSLVVPAIPTPNTIPIPTVLENRPVVLIFLVIIFLSVSLFFLLKFIKNLLIIIDNIKGNDKESFKEAKLVLMQSISYTFCFFNYIFIDRNDFKEGRIREEILAHEYVHVNQKHSLDIMFIEILIIVSWFNPFLFFFKKAIRLNHEYLADEAVIQAGNDPETYQQLLLEKVKQPIGPLMINLFNFISIKKRMIMINKKSIRKKIIGKQLLVIPLIILTAFFFTANRKINPTWNKLNPDSGISTTAGDGVSQDLLNEYQNILKKYNISSQYDLTEWRKFQESLTEIDRDRLITIYEKMSKEQQNKQLVCFFPRSSMILPEVVPTRQQIESWKNSKEYGLWIDEKHVNNSVLNNYTNQDFSQVIISRLLKNAKDYGKYYYQVNLMTKKYYNDYCKNQNETPGYFMLYRD